MQSGLFLDVVIRKSTTVLQLFACEDQPLLVWWNAFLVLYFAFTLSIVSLASTSRVIV